MSLNSVLSFQCVPGLARVSGLTPTAKATWSYGGSKPAYSVGGNTFNSSGYLANPSRSAQIEANNAGALTRYEAQKMGLPLGGRR